MATNKFIVTFLQSSLLIMPTPAEKFNLSLKAQIFLFSLSFFWVAFGQPAWIPINGLIAYFIGYALFWRVLLACTSLKQKFWLGFLWFFLVQLVQMSWFLSHPFWYIYLVYFFIATWLGLQFACTSFFIRREIFLTNSIFLILFQALSLAAFWTIMEWSRLFLLSGLSWNPAGLGSTISLYATQVASIFGVFGLSFWVFFVNYLALYVWSTLTFNAPTLNSLKSISLWLIVALLPFAYGMVKINYHEHILKSHQQNFKTITALLVQTAFPIEEGLPLSRKNFLKYVLEEWRTILEIIKPYGKAGANLIVLPEFVVPFGTYSFVYPLNEVKASFVKALGTKSLKNLPQLSYPFAVWENTTDGIVPLVNNAYWIQAIANVLEADVLAGLEDAELKSSNNIEYYSSAQFVHPQNNFLENQEGFQRYAKRVLVPMGEYIPFQFCKKLAEHYGVFGSFTCGTKSELMNCNNILFSPSICYEETYGDVIREGRNLGAELLVNLTSDVWYPNSRLPKQHLDHARLRTVENGIPLIRACNTGITAAIDSFGKTIAILGGDKPEEHEWKKDALLVHIPVQTYSTLYSKYGDSLIIGICFFILFISILNQAIGKWQGKS